VDSENPTGKPTLQVGPAGTDCPEKPSTPSPPPPEDETQKNSLKMGLEIVTDFPDGTTGESLLADEAYMGSFTSGLKGGLVKAAPALAEIPDLVKMISVTSMTLDAVTTRRRLAPMKMSAAYEVSLPKDIKVADIASSISASTDAFNSGMAQAYADAEEQRTGTRPTLTVKAGEIEVITPAPTPAPPPPATPSPPAATPSPPAPTPSPPAPSGGGAPAPAPPPEEEEGGDNTGMIVGIIIGVVAGIGILGGFFYVYKIKGQKSSS